MRTITLSLVLLLAALAGPQLARAQSAPDPGQVCSQMQRNMGDEAFAQAFGSMDGCVSKVGPILTAAVQACRGDGHEPGGSAFRACVQEKVKAGVQGSAGNAGKAKAQTQAEKICAQVKAKLGADKFEQLFGGATGCAKKAAAAMKACKGKGKPGSAEMKACIQAKLKPEQGAKAQKAAAQAKQVCAQVKKKAGAENYEKRFGGDAGCLEKAAAAMKACAKEAKPGSAEFKACLQKRLAKKP